MEAILLKVLQQFDHSVASTGVPVKESSPAMLDYIAQLVKGGYLDAKILPSFPGEDGGPVVDVAVVYGATPSGKALLGTEAIFETGVSPVAKTGEYAAS